jgi:hypothetical protein
MMMIYIVILSQFLDCVSGGIWGADDVGDLAFGCSSSYSGRREIRRQFACRFSELLQRRSFFTPETGKTGYNNKFYGLSLKWPEWLNNNWLRLFVFLILATFSTTLVAIPKISGLAVIGLLLAPTIMALVWELRAVCRFVCPVSVFVSPYSRMGSLALRNKSQDACDRCKPHYCQNGNTSGGLAHGINVGEMKENTRLRVTPECTLQLYLHNKCINIAVFSETGTRTLAKLGLSVTIFTISIVYCMVYQGLRWFSVIT